MGFTDYLGDLLKVGLGKVLRNARDDVFESFNLAIKRTIRKIIKDITGMLLIVAAVIFFAFSLIFFFIEYTGLSKTLSFLIVSIIVLLVGIIIKFKR